MSTSARNDSTCDSDKPSSDESTKQQTPVVLAPQNGAGMKFEAVACMLKTTPSAEPVYGLLVRPISNPTLVVPNASGGATPTSASSDHLVNDGSVPTDPRPSSAVPSPPRHYNPGPPTPVPSYGGQRSVNMPSANGAGHRLLLPSPAAVGGTVFDPAGMQILSHHHNAQASSVPQFQMIAPHPGTNGAHQHHGGLFHQQQPMTSHPDTPVPPMEPSGRTNRSGASIFIPASTITNYQSNNRQSNGAPSCSQVGYASGNVPPGISNSNSYETTQGCGSRSYGHPVTTVETTTGYQPVVTSSSSSGHYQDHGQFHSSVNSHHLPKDLAHIVLDPTDGGFLGDGGTEFLDPFAPDPVPYAWTSGDNQDMNQQRKYIQ